MTKPFEQLSRWEKCNDIVESAQPDWSAYRPGLASLIAKQRSVTWAEYPTRFNLTQYAAEQKRRLRSPRLVTKLFEVATLSAISNVTGRRDHRRYFIFPEDEQTKLVDMNVGELDDPQTRKEIVESFDFRLSNGLFVPNAEDILHVDHALHIAHNDGVDKMPAQL